MARRIPPPCRVREREIASGPWENTLFKCREERELVRFSEALYRWVEDQTVSAIIKKQIKFCFAHYSAARHSEQAPSALALVNRFPLFRLSDKNT